MESSTTTKQADILHGQNNVEETHREGSSELVKRKEIPGSPFTIIEDKSGYYLTMGNYRLTDGYASEQEVLEHIAINNWNVMLQMAIIVCEKVAK